MPRVTINAAPQGDLVRGMRAGTIFNYPVSATGNTGASIRLKDNGGKKNHRFANLNTGKVLIANSTDRGEVLPEGTTLTIGR